MQISKQKINTFLHYGYLPDPQVPLPESLQQWFDGKLTSPDLSNIPISKLIKIGAESLKISFKEEIGDDHDKTHIIPLSGGLDSRTILANLIEHIDRSKIIAITFGLPGSLDYVRGKSIAKKAKVKWEGIDLSPGKWKWDNDLLIETAKRSERPTWLFDNAVNQSINLKFGKDCVYWSGFMGDSLGRRHTDPKIIDNWEDAKNAFVIKNNKCNNYKLTTKDFIPQDCLPAQSIVDSGKLDYYSQLNFLIRQQCCTKHIYSPIGYYIRYPFLNPKWVSFMLNVPGHYRQRQFLYRKIQQYSWPYLFNKWNSPFYGSYKWEALIYGKSEIYLLKYLKKAFPQWTSKISGINVNYIDWNYALRYQEDFKNVIYSNIQYLKARKIIHWLDIDALWTNHQQVKMDLAAELMSLAALEIHLKAKTIF